MSSAALLAGCGNMGFAMLQGWLSAPDAPVVHVVEPNDGLRERAAKAGARAVAAPEDLPADCAPDLVFLAVKPQVMAEVAPAYARFGASANGGAAFVSVAAGVTMAGIADAVGPDAAIIRCMPNTPAAIGAGMMVCCANAATGAEARDLASRLLAASGEVAWIDDEGLMDAVTAISGSGPAYVFHFIEGLAKAGAALGLEPELALRLARQTVMGAGRLASEVETPPDILREQVTSPGGTTAAALGVLRGEDRALEALIAAAAKAARDRGAELGRG